MNGKIYLLGGGEINQGETATIDDYVLSHTSKKGDIVFIGAASNDAEGYFETFKHIYNDGSKVVFLTTLCNKKDFAAAIRKAKIVYLGGGLTELLQMQLEKWGAKDVFISALRHGTDLVGMSAGAYVLSQYYLHEDNDNYEVRKGLGLASVASLVHATADSENAALKTFKLAAVGKVPFVSISEKSALIVAQNKTGVIGEGRFFRYDAEGCTTIKIFA